MYFKVIVNLLIILISIGFVIAVTDGALEIYRGWKNKDGTLVQGYGLYEKEVVSKRLSKTMPDIFRDRQPGWELFEFHHYEIFCKWQRGFKQRDWTSERERRLKIKMYRTEDSASLYTEKELPVIRYRCAPASIYYQAKMGWGLF